MPDNKERVLSTAVEDYLKAIYKLQEGEEMVSTMSLARRCGTSPAAASKMLKNLAELKLIEHMPYYGARLTDAGQKVALEIIRHHRLLELYLHQALGYDWSEVDAEAEKLEHHISEEFEERIDRMLDYPTRDPHGDPIPTREGTIAPYRGRSLADSQPGETLVILRVKDENPEVLRYLSRLGMRLESILRVKDRQALDGALTLDIAGETHSIGRELAGYVFVENCILEEVVS
jgi:DtxR family Mn-dependent transcriptional regulator